MQQKGAISPATLCAIQRALDDDDEDQDDQHRGPGPSRKGALGVAAPSSRLCAGDAAADSAPGPQSPCHHLVESPGPVMGNSDSDGGEKGPSGLLCFSLAESTKPTQEEGAWTPAVASTQEAHECGRALSPIPQVPPGPVAGSQGDGDSAAVGRCEIPTLTIGAPSPEATIPAALASDTGKTSVQGAPSVQSTGSMQGALGEQEISGAVRGALGIQGALKVQGAPSVQSTGSMQGASDMEGALGVQGTPGVQRAPSMERVGSMPGAPDVQEISGVQGALDIQEASNVQGTPGMQRADSTQRASGVQGTHSVQGALGVQGVQDVQGTPSVQRADSLQGAPGLQGTLSVQEVPFSRFEAAHNSGSSTIPASALQLGTLDSTDDDLPDGQSKADSADSDSDGRCHCSRWPGAICRADWGGGFSP